MEKLNMRPKQTKGFLFTFCGLDGCGKTTMLTMLKEDLEKEHNVFLTKQLCLVLKMHKFLLTFSQ